MDAQTSNYIHQILERKLRGVNITIHALVSSYDPKTHKAKVLLQPNGQETGWLQIHAHHIGNGWGQVHGLQVNDQVMVSHQYGDLESGIVVGRVHDDSEKAPEVKSGEMLLQHEKGQKVFLAADGSATFQDGGGAVTAHDGKGNITTTCKTLTVNASGKVAINGSPVDING